MAPHPRRPGFLCICGVVATLICVNVVYAAEDARIRIETLTYKKVGNLEIKADLHRAGDRPSDRLSCGFTAVRSSPAIGKGWTGEFEACC